MQEVDGICGEREDSSKKSIHQTLARSRHRDGVVMNSHSTHVPYPTPSILDPQPHNPKPQHQRQKAIGRDVSDAVRGREESVGAAIRDLHAELRHRLREALPQRSDVGHEHLHAHTQKKVSGHAREKNSVSNRRKHTPACMHMCVCARAQTHPHAHVRTDPRTFTSRNDNLPPSDQHWRHAALSGPPSPCTALNAHT